MDGRPARRRTPNGGWPRAIGLIVSRPADAALPWERIITASLGPPAAGRIEWRRQVYVRADPEQRFGSDNRIGAIPTTASGPRGVPVRLPRLDPVYADHYGRRSRPARSSPGRHAIGAAIITSPGAGEVDAQPSEGGTRLLGTEELRVGDPSLIIVQADRLPRTGRPPRRRRRVAAAVEVARQSTDELRTSSTRPRPDHVGRRPRRPLAPRPPT